MRSSDFEELTLRERGEAVFRLQNDMLDKLITASAAAPDGQTPDAGVLEAAEDELVDSCRSMNEAASMRAAGREPGVALKLEVLDSLSRCESAARKVETLVESGSGVLSAASP